MQATEAPINPIIKIQYLPLSILILSNFVPPLENSTTGIAIPSILSFSFSTLVNTSNKIASSHAQTARCCFCLQIKYYYIIWMLKLVTIYERKANVIESSFILPTISWRTNWFKVIFFAWKNVLFTFFTGSLQIFLITR